MGYFGNICALCVLVFAVGSINFTEARSTNALIRHEAKRDIPDRCITNSVTPVTCDHATITDNLLPHPDDCQLFYYCLGADLPPICRQCPAGLHFNPKKHVCDQPQQAGCQSSDSSSTASPSTEVPDSTPPRLVPTTEESESTFPTTISTTKRPVSTTRAPVYTTLRTTTTTRKSGWCWWWC
ncbi:probable chitinase 10 [Maniola jurtina]|uniref:probable chitinase 10 n=1 Tax=Maniola jurtina TaxID=191418 RepID=UPI001E68D2DD|nr:probable chitinase 10 [Maniola jurtina]